MEDRKSSSAHVLAFPYPSQGHINPMFQFCKRLASKGLKTTMALTTFISNSVNPKSDVVEFDTISDGYDQGGFTQASDIPDYLEQLKSVGSKTLAELINRHRSLGNPIDCIVYDSFMPWVLDLAKEFGLKGASFSRNLVPSLMWMPLLDQKDMPSFIYAYGSYPAYCELVLGQFSNWTKADFVLVNTFYKLEEKVIDTMAKLNPMMTIGPTIPSYYLDNNVKNDVGYGLNLFSSNTSECLTWLENKLPGSVVYVSFGSMSSLSSEQMEEVAWGLKNCGSYFVWVVRGSENDKLPTKFEEEIHDKGILVNWCPQLQVLSDKSIGCFFSHCGWNSTIEALSLGVPIVGIPQWTDQPTNAKFVQDVWKVGIRVNVDEKGIVGRKEIESCIREMLEGEKGKEMKRNAIKWKELAIEAVSEGGSSDTDIDEFVSKLRV